MRVDPAGSTDVTLVAGLWNGDELKLLKVPFEDRVGDLLVEMAIKTRASFSGIDGEPQLFNPSEKPAAEDKVYLPNTAEDCLIANLCYATVAYEDDPHVLANLSEMRFYLASIVNPNNQRVVCVKSAGVFKRVGTRNPLIALINDRLQAYESPIFQLDSEFDFVIEADSIYILKPKQFIFTCQMQEAIKAAAPHNVEAIREFLPRYNLKPIVDVSQTTRVANLLASIRSLDIFYDFSVDKFHLRCIQIGIEFIQSDDGLAPGEEHLIKFLEVLDCRRYSTDFTNGAPSEWVASGRNRA